MKDDPDVQTAVDLARSGKLHDALLSLKMSKNMSLGDARSLIAERLEAEKNLQGTTSSHQEQAITEAMDAISTFDELTVEVLRHCKEHGLPIATEAAPVATVKLRSTEIIRSLQWLVKNNVNPTRVLRAAMSDDADSSFDEAVKTRLVDDLTSLL